MNRAVEVSDYSRWRGFYTLFSKEVRRFWKVFGQTVTAPVLNILLYFFVFGHIIPEHNNIAVGYTAFLAPGLLMMSILQNAFANSSSSLIQSKLLGNLVFLLLSPLSHGEIFAAYVLAATLRGLVVGLAVWLAVVWFVPMSFFSISWILLFAFFSAWVLATLGLFAGIVAEKFDHIAAFQNFIIMPATFLAGVFYSVQNLPTWWQWISYFNPFFYMIDGFRYGFFGASDVPPERSFTILLTMLIIFSYIVIKLLQSGYKLRR